MVGSGSSARAAAEDAARAQQEGGRLRQKYDDLVRIRPQLLRDSGLEGQPTHTHALAGLAGKCFSAPEDSEYVYDVCLYTRATQRPKKKTSQSIRLGVRWEWIEVGAHGRLSGGDRCPAGQLRSLDISFVCSDREWLSQLREPSTCAYTTVLSTPAACSPNGLVCSFARKNKIKNILCLRGVSIPQDEKLEFAHCQVKIAPWLLAVLPADKRVSSTHL
eukprot:5130806-Pleurochrysis_carterae.AAC.2